MPIVLGLEEKLENTAIRYMQRQGFHSMAIEGGLHTSQNSVEYLMWGVWKIFKNISVVDLDEPHLFQTIKQKIDSHQAQLPSILDVDYLHNVVPGDHFIIEAWF